MSDIQVLGTSMHLEESENSEGRPVLFLHGNPTSSHLWRHVIARRRPGWRCLAPDLIGMGHSAKPYPRYTFADHAAHLDALLTALTPQLEPGLVVVGHDWGDALALDLARRRPDQVSAIALMEGHLRPLPGWEAFDPGGRDLFQRLRTPGVGEQMVLQENFFLDTLLPAALTRPLLETDLDAYRRPYPDARSRQALLDWPRQIPIAGQPPEAHAALAAGIAAASASPVPKLLVTAPGTPIVTPEVIDWCRGNLPNLTVTDVGGPAGHFLPEDRPTEVADAIWNWLSALPAQASGTASR